MKLLHYTYRNLFLLLLILFSLWGVLFYVTMLEEIVDETDDALENYRDILVKTALKDPSILDTKGTLMTLYTFTPITSAEAAVYEDKYYNATVYIEIEDEHEPVRVMKSCFMMPDEQFYEIELMISTVEKEDMIETILIYLLSLFVLLIICFAILVRWILKRSFRPLDKLIKWLEHLQPGKEIVPLNNDTEIVEFKKLSEAAVEMNQRSYKAFQDQKQFIENASHELQTPLAIIRAKIELLAESGELTEEQLKELDEMYNTLGRAVKLNRSLLLLSRIENKQYTETEKVSFNETIENSLDELKEIYESKNIHYVVGDNSSFIYACNKHLARILINNLIKNAMSHVCNNGTIEIIINENRIDIRNDGNESLDKERIFQRFYHETTNRKDSTGLGLSIAKSIAESYGLSLLYKWENNKHVFSIQK